MTDTAKITAKIKITEFVAFEASGSDISNPKADSGYQPALVRELARAVRQDGCTVELDAEGFRDLAEWADAMVAPNAQGGNPSGARAMAVLSDRCLEQAKALEEAGARA